MLIIILMHCTTVAALLIIATLLHICGFIPAVLFIFLGTNTPVFAIWYCILDFFFTAYVYVYFLITLACTHYILIAALIF